jgi:nicotinate-nucleotide adenylyltransferase
MRVGILGGTFDPVHFGHLEIANKVQEVFSCDYIYLVPAYTPPHKAKSSISSPYHRYAMAVLAASENKNIVVSLLELESPTKPFSVQTVAQLRKTLEPQAELFFIIGTDLFAELDSWWHYQELINGCNIVVVTRPSHKVDLTERSIALQKEIKDLRGCKKFAEQITQPTIFFTNLLEESISATNIRSAVIKKQPISQWVPQSVADYIFKYKLYSG